MQRADIWAGVRKERHEALRAFYRCRKSFSKGYRRPLEKEVEDFLDMLSGRILVIGCGSGKEVAYLSEDRLPQGRCDVFGIDFSPEAIQFAQEEHPYLADRFSVGDLYDLDTLLNGKFDGIVANAVLLHLLERSDMPSILQKMRGRLKKGGLCFIRLIEKEEILPLSIRLEFAADLDSNNISKVSRELQSNGISLPDSATVVSNKLGSEWAIFGELNKDYIIRREANGLKVYRVLKEEMDHHRSSERHATEDRWFVYYTKEDVERFAEETGFIVERIEKCQHMEYEGIYWVLALLRKPN